MSRSRLLETGLDAAAAAADIIRRYYRDDFEVRLKEDQSPVTVADVEAEKVIKTVISREYPDHGFYGEETGQSRTDAEYVWIIDPIDGTKGFIRRYPFFSTQLALMRDGDFIIGISSAPVFGELAYAERGNGAWLNDSQVHVSDVARIEDSTVSTGNLRSLAAGERWASFGKLVTRLDRIRGYGDFYQYHLLAAGCIDAVLETNVKIYDIAALVVIVEEAGGTFTDITGAPVTLDTSSVLASNGHLHQELQTALA